MNGNYTCGLDLGVVRDHSVLAVVERVEVYNGRPRTVWQNEVGLVEVEDTDTHWLVPGVRRWPLGVDYTDVVRDLSLQLEESRLTDATLRFDQTGVGRAVRDLLRAEWRDGRLTETAPHGYSLTAGREPGEGTVPKRDVVAAVADALLRDRLHIAPSLADAAQIRRELESFRVEVTASGHERYAAARESDHDDTITALGLCLFRKHHRTPPRKLARSFFLSHVLSGAEDKPAGEVLR